MFKYLRMETNYTCINYLNKEDDIIQYLSESDTQFTQRLEYIKLLEKANVDWKEAVIDAARQYELSQVADALPSVHQEYIFRFY